MKQIKYQKLHTAGILQLIAGGLCLLFSAALLLWFFRLDALDKRPPTVSPSYENALLILPGVYLIAAVLMGPYYFGMGVYLFGIARGRKFSLSRYHSCVSSRIAFMTGTVAAVFIIFLMKKFYRCALPLSLFLTACEAFFVLAYAYERCAFKDYDQKKYEESRRIQDPSALLSYDAFADENAALKKRVKIQRIFLAAAAVIAVLLCVLLSLFAR